jgi:hypothetical protein
MVHKRPVPPRQNVDVVWEGRYLFVMGSEAANLRPKGAKLDAPATDQQHNVESKAGNMTKAERSTLPPPPPFSKDSPEKPRPTMGKFPDEGG